MGTCREAGVLRRSVAENLLYRLTHGLRTQERPRAGIPLAVLDTYVIHISFSYAPWNIFLKVFALLILRHLPLQGQVEMNP